MISTSYSLNRLEYISIYAFVNVFPKTETASSMFGKFLRSHSFYANSLSLCKKTLPGMVTNV